MKSKVPFRDQVVDQLGNLTQVWQKLMQDIEKALNFIGEEQSFPLVNNTAVAANVTPMKYNKSLISAVFFDYLIQRVTELGELNESGSFSIHYNPVGLNWTLLGTPTLAGVTLSILATGQVQYTSSAQLGTNTISRIVFRARELAGKSSTYSRAG